LIDEYRTSVIIDLGMCLKVPFDAGETGLDATDVSFGTFRRLIKKLVPCGKPNYISPEVLRSEGPFDGYAIDLWAAAVILFIMLVGLPPWEFAHADDERYKMITRGGLERMLHTWDKPISPLAADLLQRMFREDPRHRLNLIDVKDHPWVVNEDGSDQNSNYINDINDHQRIPSTNDEGWRGTMQLP
jgi:serine/threonine protein kinase